MGQNLVKEFHLKFKLPVSDFPLTTHEIDWDHMAQRWRWQMDEMREMAAAILSRDVAALADAVIDAEYFGRGTLVEIGVDGDPLFNAVHDANMTKVKIPGVAKIQKPDGWQEPDIAALIEEQR